MTLQLKTPEVGSQDYYIRSNPSEETDHGSFRLPATFKGEKVIRKIELPVYANVGSLKCSGPGRFAATNKYDKFRCD
tara:strand:- start:8457 stop:8687 length:231 start_codon:yes stop_codon:yes gene_type:complete